MNKQIIIILILILILILMSVFIFSKSSFSSNKSIFPFRQLCNEKREIIPIVALTSFFRNDKDIQRYNDYISNGIIVIGYTSYKSFPKPISDDSLDKNTLDDTFEYTKKIKNWVCCFKNPINYGFTNYNNLLEMSESDFIDASSDIGLDKKYDFIYNCLPDDANTCPLNGWNAINRNFNLALKCFPIMINEFNLKILVIGRLNCGLEELYKDNIEVIGQLPYNEFQNKLKESKYLFIPNIYDASPRVITEAISKNIPVLMNSSILCGSKYINYETGEFFTDEYDIRLSLKNLLNKNISPKKWWEQNYSKSKSGIKFKNWLYNFYPDILKNTTEVLFY